MLKDILAIYTNTIRDIMVANMTNKIYLRLWKLCQQSENETENTIDRIFNFIMTLLSLLHLNISIFWEIGFEFSCNLKNICIFKV